MRMRPVVDRSFPTTSRFQRRAVSNERGRLRCHKRPKSREETPKEGIGDNDVAAPQ